MGSELVTAEPSWLEIVKAAANAEEQRDDELQLGPSSVEPTWINQPEDSNDNAAAESRLSDLLKPLALGNKSDISAKKNDEQVLFDELGKILRQPNTLSKQSFLGFLGSYLRTLNSTENEVTFREKKSSGLRSNGVIEGKDEESTLMLLKEHCRLLGQRLIRLILECCLSLRFWAPIEILFKRRVVDNNSSSRLVETLVEEENLLLLTLYIRNTPDFSPKDVYILLTFFLDSIQNPSKSFGPVKSEWRRVAKEEMGKFVTNRDAIQAATENAMYLNLENLTRSHHRLVSSTVGLAMAIDNFSAPELCIHHLLVAGPDEVVLSSVVAQLSTGQVLDLTRYLCRWVQCYTSHLENFPAPESGRVPSLAQVLGWVGVVLEAHFTQIVLSSDFHRELRDMRDMVQSLIDFGAGMTPLGGITEHIRAQRFLPVRKQRGGTTSDYVIELLDMS